MFFFKQKTAYEMRISDWSSDVCSSDLNFRGAGWNVIKTIWGSYWDPLLARDTSGKLRQIMMETVDGEYQNCKAFGGAYTREHFFGKTPETAALVANLSDDDV